MKKSAHYTAAMIAVIKDNDLPNRIKVEIIETLVTDKQSALYREEREEKEAADHEAV